LRGRKINNSEYGRRIDQREKAVSEKFVKLTLSLHNWQLIQRFKVRLMLPRQLVSPFLLKDLKTGKIAGH